MLVPQTTPPDLLLPSTHVCAPAVQDVTPFLQTLGLPVQAAPAVQATQVPAPLQTMLVPQLVPAALLVPSMQVVMPVVQETTPFLQMLGLAAQAMPGMQSSQPPPWQNLFVPQAEPSGLLAPSTHVIAPVMHEVWPALQTLGLVVQGAPAVQATQVPEPLQTMLVPQLTPGALLPPSMHVIAPDAQAVVPFLQTVGLPAQATPAVQVMHAPTPLHTWLTPQLEPAGFAPPFTHVALPVMHDATPL
jgi:hypothetical protein